MFPGPFFVLSILSTTFALSINYARGPGGMLIKRDDPYPGFSEQDLLSSCPGAPGTDKLERADRCTLINIVENPNVRKWVVLGDPQLNCGGAQDPVTVELGGEQTVSETTSINANIGINLEGIEIGGGAESSSTTSTTVSKTISYTIPAGRQAVYVAGTAHTSETGNIQINYGDRQYGHYIWYTISTVTMLSPIADDVQYDVHETDCGTDPRDLSSYNN